MSEEKLRDLIDQLRDEIGALPTEDIDARTRLGGILAELEQQLEDDGSGEPAEGVMAAIQDTVHQIEARHPDATTLLNNIMMTLANMGI